MALILKEVDKGICECCLGIGLPPRYNEPYPIQKKIKTITTFDFDVCVVCGGSGRKIVIE